MKFLTNVCDYCDGTSFSTHRRMAIQKVFDSYIPLLLTVKLYPVPVISQFQHCAIWIIVVLFTKVLKISSLYRKFTSRLSHRNFTAYGRKGPIVADITAGGETREDVSREGRLSARFQEQEDQVSLMSNFNVNNRKERPLCS